MTIWQACDGPARIERLSGTLQRLVESQEQVATLGYVDTLEEQALLETLLDASKPPYAEVGARLHYLLRTPFRYPPLPWGSRFGRPHEPSLCYGGKSAATTLAEAAYYRLVFWYSMTAPPPKSSIQSAHTLFSASYSSTQGVRLQAAPFSAYQAQLVDPADYRATQALGSAMRAAGVEAFEYRSARDPAGGLCVALFTPAAFSASQPTAMSQWLCELSAGEVALKPLGQAQLTRFALDDFLVEGRLPHPA